MKITEKYVLNLFLSILLIFSIIGTGATTFLKNYVLVSDTFIENVEENDIHKMAYDELNEYFTNSADYSSIPADIYMSVISEEDVKLIIEYKINALFNYIKGDEKKAYLNESMDYSELKTSIANYFDEFAKKNNVEVDDTYTSQLEKTIETAISEVETIADVYMIELIDNTGIIEKLIRNKDLIDYVMYGCIGLAVVCVIIMLIASIKRIGNLLYWVSISGICASCLGLVPTLYLKISGITDKFIVRTECVYEAYTDFMNGCINTLFKGEVIILAISVALLIIGLIVAKFTNRK